MHKSGLKLGILGGGQLGRMMIAASEKMGFHYHVLDPDPQAACHTISQFTKGSYADFDQVLNFGRHVDCLTTEIEHVNTEALTLLATQIPVYPQPHILQMIQDKGLQKEFYKKHGFPTAPFALIANRAMLAAHKDLFPAMQKLRRCGYDGKGVVSLDTPDNPNAFDAPSVLEKRIEIAKEIAILICRDTFGNMVTYTPVEMVVGKNHMLGYLKSPANIPDTLAKTCIALAREIAETLEIVGMLALEIIIDTDARIWINEMAPRPHNSGHHTIESASVSQFEQHIRAISGHTVLPITEKPAVMYNILGGDKAGPAHWHYPDTPDTVHLHIYGKADSKPNRKMGHLTVVREHLEKAISDATATFQTLSVNGHA